MAQYVRMSGQGAFQMRVSARSFGLAPSTRLTMKSQGAGLFGRLGDKIRYFGDKYFLDGALSTAGARPGEAMPVARARYGVQELRDFMLFAGPFGTAYHTQSRQGAERLVAARAPIVSRREHSLPDIIDHCGRCGGGGLPQRIKAAGFRVTVLPGQLHELPQILAGLPDRDRASVLAIRELFAAGLRPAITSDWPYGAETSYPGVPDGLQRLGLAPLANVAVAVSGKTPAGRKIDGVASRTIPVGQALLGVTVYGARAIGRDDVGRLVPGARADFVVLPVSPFKVDPLALYRVDPDATYVDGVLVSTRDRDADPDVDVSRFASQPSGAAFSPVLGYDPVTSFLVGGAYFFYPYEPHGLRGSVQAYFAPAQLRGRLEMEMVGMRAFGAVSPRAWARFDALKDRYYGVGMNTNPDAYDVTEPVRVDASLGVSVAVGRAWSVGVHGVGGFLHDRAARNIMARGAGAEGHVDGAFAGGRLELVDDDRDNEFATRYGGRRIVWTESYVAQAGRASFRQRFGLSATQFIPLRAPDFVLALRAEGAGSAGEAAYVTDYALGGGDILRGYYSNRFRGRYYAAGSTELRFPLLLALSGAAFVDAGRVWVEDLDESGGVAWTYGGGLRYGLPPDRLVRLRLDAGFAPDQWGIFFKFGEAY